MPFTSGLVYSLRPFWTGLTDLIQDELKHVLANWTKGRPVHSIALGHAVRVVSDNTGTREERHSFRQRKVHDYCFSLINEGLQYGEPMSYALFAMLDVAPPGLSAQEKQSAESLAWKALSRGWERAVSGFP